MNVKATVYTTEGGGQSFSNVENIEIEEGFLAIGHTTDDGKQRQVMIPLSRVVQFEQEEVTIH